jgi:hypothetical protein
MHMRVQLRSQLIQHVSLELERIRIETRATFNQLIRDGSGSLFSHRGVTKIGRFKAANVNPPGGCAGCN